MWYKTLYWNRGTSRRFWALKFANFSSNENVQNIENNENLQNITFSLKLSKSPLKMGQLCTFLNKLFVVRITIDLGFKRFFCDTWSRACKTRSESLETNNPPVRRKKLSDRSKNYIYVNSLPSATLWIFWRIFDFSLLQTSSRYLLTSALKVASEKSDAWSMHVSHSPRCIIVASLVNYMPATSLET